MIILDLTPGNKGVLELGYLLICIFMSYKYFSELYNDLVQLSLNPNRFPIGEPTGSDVFRAVLCTRNIGQSRLPEDLSLSTAVGKRILELDKAGVSGGSHVYRNLFGICREAEACFARNIAPSRNVQLQNTLQGRPPIIYTHDDRPVAFTKGLGEPTTIGLDDSPKHGIYRGALALALPKAFINPLILPTHPSVRAYQIELSGTHLFHTLRLTAAALPLNQRRGLYTLDGLGVMLDTDALILDAQALLEDAERLSPDEEAIAVNQTALHHHLPTPC